MSTFDQTGAHDLVLTAAKRLSIITDPDQADAIILANKFRRFLGEWFLDTREGVDYVGLVFVKNADLGAIAQMFRLVIWSMPRVTDIPVFQISVDPMTRAGVFSFAATTVSGATITGGSNQPFIVTGTQQ